MTPLDELIAQGALMPMRSGCLASLEEAARAAERIPPVEASDHGKGKAIAASGMRGLMRSIERLRDPIAKAQICTAIGLVAEALKREPDRPWSEKQRNAWWLEKETA